MTFTLPELQHLLSLMGYDTGHSPIRPGQGLTAEGALALKDKMAREYEERTKER